MLPALGEPVTAADGVFAGPRARRSAAAAPWLLLVAAVLLSFDYIRRASEVS